MRAIVVVVALFVALGAAADFYWYGGAYTRMVIRSLSVGFYFLVNNWRVWPTRSSSCGAAA
jgi:hypothetical protein